MSAEFSQTRMGQEFYEGTMKNINKNLGRIADALEALVKQGEHNTEVGENVSQTMEEIKERMAYLMR